PRYGLSGYKKETLPLDLTAADLKILEDLSRAGKRLKGFCRTNLFKRLESSGYAFLLSIERHILRNYIFLHALENGLPLPVGTQDAALLDSRFEDEDKDGDLGDTFDIESTDLDDDVDDVESVETSGLRSET